MRNSSLYKNKNDNIYYINNLKMISKNFSCSFCEYKSCKKYNLERHMITKHKNEYDIKNTDINNNTDIINNNTDINNKCIKCNKILSSKQYLEKHLLICKGVSNPLECHLCHKIYYDSSSKSRHLKLCKKTFVSSNELTLPSSLSLPSIITAPISLPSIITAPTTIITAPTTTTTTITNNSNNNSNNIININLVMFDNENNKIDFDTNNINKDISYKLTSIDKHNAFEYFCNKLFENKNNQMIIKKNLKYNYSFVHMGNNIWRNHMDNFIYPIIMSYISETLLSIIDNNRDKRTIELIKYLDVMATPNGDSNTDTIYYSKCYKYNISMLKLLVNKFPE